MGLRGLSFAPERFVAASSMERRPPMSIVIGLFAPFATRHAPSSSPCVAKPSCVGWWQLPRLQMFCLPRTSKARKPSTQETVALSGFVAFETSLSCTTTAAAARKQSPICQITRAQTSDARLGLASVGEPLLLCLVVCLVPAAKKWRTARIPAATQSTNFAGPKPLEERAALSVSHRPAKRRERAVKRP